MGRAMAWRDILASLTTNPSTFFKNPTKGRVEKGLSADLVVLDADPASDVRNFAKVAYSIREGKIIYRIMPNRNNVRLVQITVYQREESGLLVTNRINRRSLRYAALRSG